jgi:hypothetical protein|tara:strand:+ start:232 stop:1821 length:1590 start_codon:yes stop_codon:yes gene_type:complete
MSKVASITRAGGLIVNPQHATASTTQYARGYVSEGAVVTDGLKFYLDVADYASYPGERSIATTWSDYASHQADYDVVGDDGVILLGTYTSWAGRFPFTVARTGKHTVMFDYWSDNDSVTWSIDNDGVNNNDYNTTLTANKKKQTFSKTVNLTSTGSSTMYMRPHATGSKVYVSNFRFFYDKKYTADFSAGTDTWGAGGGSVAGNVDSIGGQNDNLRFTINTATSVHYMHFNNGGNWSSVGDTIRITFDYYIPSGNGQLDQLAFGVYGPATTMTTADSWTSVDITFDVTQSYGFIIYGTDGGTTTYTDSGGNDVFYIRNFTYTETAGNDLSGNGHNGIFVGAPTFNFSNDPPIHYITFDGSDDYLEAPQGFQIGNVRQKTVEAWVGDWSSGTIVSMTDHANNYKWQQHARGTSQIMTGSGYGTRYGFPEGYTASGWHHWVDVCDEDLTATNRVKRYIDGVLISSNSQSTDTGDSFYDGTDLFLHVGAMNYGSGPANFFNGKIAIVRIYDSALTHAQAKQNFNAERNRFGV